RAAAERWEADAEYGADVAVAGAGDDFLLQAQGGFVQQRQYATVGDFLGRRRLAGFDVEQLINIRIDHFSHTLTTVVVEAFFDFLADPFVGHQLVDDRRGLDARAVGGFENVLDLDADVDADFVQQLERAYRKTPPGQAFVDQVERHAFHRQVAGFVDVGK